MLTKRKRIFLAVVLFVVASGITVGVVILAFLGRDVPEVYAEDSEHFKYGSIGSELMPYWVWLVLPDLFIHKLPDRPGRGYEKMGLIYESETAQRPIGTSYRERPIPLVGLNCGVCHTGTLRDSPDSERQIVLAMPAHNFDLLSYERFLFEIAQDPRFNADTIIPAIKKVNPDFSWLDSLLYRFIVIPRFKKALIEFKAQFAWDKYRPDSGPGRTDTFNPFNEFYDLHPESDFTVGTADLPSIWNQQIRDGMQLHWDGNNTSEMERNINAARGAGGIHGMEDKIDLEGINRVAGYIRTLQPPLFPIDRIDTSRADSGSIVYNNYCAQCHGVDGYKGGKAGQVTPLYEIGTDPERLRSFTVRLAEKLDTAGSGRSWAFTHFRKTDGYANVPLDGIWLRAPYLHNGSVPTLRDLLNPPEERPRTFYRGYDVYDYENLGFVTSGSDAETQGWRFDTSQRGNSNEGHLYGTELDEDEKGDLLEYLKTR